MWYVRVWDMDFMWGKPPN